MYKHLKFAIHNINILLIICNSFFNINSYRFYVERYSIVQVVCNIAIFSYINYGSVKVELKLIIGIKSSLSKFPVP